MFTGRVYDRENHRSERFKLERHANDRREYELVHELLDRMILEDRLKRYQSAELAAFAVDELIRVLEAKGRADIEKLRPPMRFLRAGPV